MLWTEGRFGSPDTPAELLYAPVHCLGSSCALELTGTPIGVPIGYRSPLAGPLCPASMFLRFAVEDWLGCVVRTGCQSRLFSSS